MNKLLLTIGLGLAGYLIYKNLSDNSDNNEVLLVGNDVYAKNDVNVYEAIDTGQVSIGGMQYIKGPLLFKANKGEYLGKITNILFLNMTGGNDVAIVKNIPFMKIYFIETKNLTQQSNENS